jgi:hypothetical protein
VLFSKTGVEKAHWLPDEKEIAAFAKTCVHRRLVPFFCGGFIEHIPSAGDWIRGKPIPFQLTGLIDLRNLEAPYLDKIQAVPLQRCWYHDPDKEVSGEKLLLGGIFGEADFSDYPASLETPQQ